MNNVKVSVIVPVYKVEELLLRCCLESLAHQTLQEIEIILVDDGCPIGGGTICDEYARCHKRIKVIHQKNQGISVARNAGLDVARGEYYTFVDADDYVSEDYCRILYDMARTTGADIVSCGSYRENPYTGEKSLLFRNRTTVYWKSTDLETLRLILLRTMALNKREGSYPNNHFVWGHLYRQEAMGDLRFQKDILGGEDKLFNFFALHRCKTYCCKDAALYHYIVRNTSETARFAPNALKGALNTYGIYRSLPEVETKPEYRDAYYIRTCCMMLAMSRSFFRHPDNPSTSTGKEIAKFCRHPLTAEAIQNVNVREMRFCKMKIAIYLLKLHLYKMSFEFVYRCKL